VAVLLAVLTAAMFCGTHSMVGNDMAPSLLSGDRMIVNRLAYLGRLPYRGELVLVPLGPRNALLRVIGIGGDTVEISKGTVRVGTAILPEPYRSPVMPEELKRSEGRWRVPGGQVFVLGDNRAHSVDSRRFGPVPVETLGGQAVFRFAPFERRGWL